MGLQVEPETGWVLKAQGSGVCASLSSALQRGLTIQHQITYLVPKVTRGSWQKYQTRWGEGGEGMMGGGGKNFLYSSAHPGTAFHIVKQSPRLPA